MTETGTLSARWLSDHGDALWSFIRARVRSTDTAEDLMQETLVAALASSNSFAGRSSERTWLLGIASHKITDHFRALRRHEQLPDEHAPTPEHTTSGKWKSLPRQWDAGRTSQDPDLTRALRHCLESLPPALSELVWLHEILRIPREEVCKILGVSTTNLWTRAHRARAALRRCIEGQVSVEHR